MGKCLCNSDIETSFICMKDNVYLCENCLTCRNPDIYCKFRTACPIWFIDKHGENWEEEPGAKENDNDGPSQEAENKTE